MAAQWFRQTALFAFICFLLSRESTITALQCLTNHYRLPSGECSPCSTCPANEEDVIPCSRRQDTVCFRRDTGHKRHVTHFDCSAMYGAFLECNFPVSLKQSKKQFNRLKRRACRQSQRYIEGLERRVEIVSKYQCSEPNQFIWDPAGQWQHICRTCSECILGSHVVQPCNGTQDTLCNLPRVPNTTKLFDFECDSPKTARLQVYTDRPKHFSDKQHRNIQRQFRESFCKVLTRYMRASFRYTSRTGNGQPSHSTVRPSVMTVLPPKNTKTKQHGINSWGTAEKSSDFTSETRTGYEERFSGSGRALDLILVIGIASGALILATISMSTGAVYFFYKRSRVAWRSWSQHLSRNEVRPEEVQPLSQPEYSNARFDDENTAEYHHLIEKTLRSHHVTQSLHPRRSHPESLGSCHSSDVQPVTQEALAETAASYSTDGQVPRSALAVPRTLQAVQESARPLKAYVSSSNLQENYPHDKFWMDTFVSSDSTDRKFPWRRGNTPQNAASSISQDGDTERKPIHMTAHADAVSVATTGADMDVNAQSQAVTEGSSQTLATNPVPFNIYLRDASSASSEERYCPGRLAEGTRVLLSSVGVSVGVSGVFDAETMDWFESQHFDISRDGNEPGRLDPNVQMHQLKEYNLPDAQPAESREHRAHEDGSKDAREENDEDGENSCAVLDGQPSVTDDMSSHSQ